MPMPRKPLTANDSRHGTPAGYSAHRKEGSDPCIDCTTARRKYIRDWRATRRLLGQPA